MCIHTINKFHNGTPKAESKQQSPGVQKDAVAIMVLLLTALVLLTVVYTREENSTREIDGLIFDAEWKNRPREMPQLIWFSGCVVKVYDL